MAHELDMSLGQAAMAYVEGSETPWHGLGFQVNPNATPDEWRDAAGLNWEAKKSVIWFEGNNDRELRPVPKRRALFRSDTQAVLSTVGENYNTVQPKEIVDFFGDLSKTGDYSIETVGALFGGRRIWALARVGPNAMVKDDAVAPYLLLTTSYDGTAATSARFTPIRVVCNNTLSAAMYGKKNVVNLIHSSKFDPVKMRESLGIAISAWDNFMLDARRLADATVTPEQVDAYLQELIGTVVPSGKLWTPETIQNTKGYKGILELFNGNQIGTGQDAVAGTAWGLLNATTEYVDHSKGKLQDNRLESAWFGAGAEFKTKAQELALQLA